MVFSLRDQCFIHISVRLLFDHSVAFNANVDVLLILSATVCGFDWVRGFPGTTRAMRIGLRVVQWTVGLGRWIFGSDWHHVLLLSIASTIKDRLEVILCHLIVDTN
jgi:hypothetical protein